MDISSPKLNSSRRSNQFEGKNCKPGKGIFPTTGESPRRVNEANNVCIKGTVDRVQDRHFCKSKVCTQQHDTNDEVYIVSDRSGRSREGSYILQHVSIRQSIETQRGNTNDKRCWTTLVKSTSRTDKKTSSDSTTDSNHLHVSVLQMTLKLAFAELFIVRDFDGCFVFDGFFVGWC